MAMIVMHQRPLVGVFPSSIRPYTCVHVCCTLRPSVRTFYPLLRAWSQAITRVTNTHSYFPGERLAVLASAAMHCVDTTLRQG